MTVSHRVLVTGGAGFLGSHLCERLVADGHEVIALDDLSTGSRTNLDALLSSPRFRFIEHDVVEPFDADVDRIFNLACPASPRHYQRDPVRTTLTCVLGTLHGLQLAEKRGARFVQASTSEVYGDPTVHPQPESYAGNVNPIGPRACYDEGKRCAESLVADFRRTRNVDARIARIFNTYGPRMALDDGRVVSEFVVNALRGEPLNVYGTGAQTRSLCYVDDLIDGLVRLMNHPSTPGPLNLGNPAELTVFDLACRIIALTKSASRIAYGPLPQDDPTQRRPNIDAAMQQLGYAPRIELDEGLRRTIASFAERAQLSPPERARRTQ